MVYTASTTQVQRFYEAQYGNIATLAGAGKAVTALTLQVAPFDSINVAVTAATKDATLDIDASIDGTTYAVAILHAHPVTAGTTHIETITNTGYRAITVLINQEATGTVDVFYVMK